MKNLEEERDFTEEAPVHNRSWLKSTRETERTLWNKLYLNMEQALAGKTSEDINLNLVYMAVRADRAELEGDLKEARWLRDYAESIRRERE